AVPGRGPRWPASTGTTAPHGPHGPDRSRRPLPSGTPRRGEAVAGVIASNITIFTTPGSTLLNEIQVVVHPGHWAQHLCHVCDQVPVALAHSHALLAHGCLQVNAGQQQPVQ